MELHAICYVSTVSTDFKQQAVMQLFDFVVKKNKELGITGLLLHSDGNFMQLMEGDKEIIDMLYKNIKEDPRHHHLIEILNESIEHRIYENYETGFSIINTEKAIFKLRLFVNWLEQNFEGKIKKRAELIQPFIKYI